MEKTSYEVLAETRTGIEEILAKMLFIKKEGKNRGELRELITQASVAFLSLRQINRIILQEEDRTKQETEAAKLPVDHTTLQLNNLLYQKNHYLKAISACKDFKSKYPDIELVPEDIFFRYAPEEFKRDPLLKQDPHRTMLERLNYELYQRKELCKKRELLEARKKMLQESIASRKKFLSSLPSHLKALKKASLPVQQQLGILHTKRMKQHHLAELLPAPLYILYTQILAQKEAFDEDIDLDIIGNAKDAQTIARQQAIKDSGINVGGQEESKIEDEQQDEDDDSQRRRKRVKKSSLKETVDEGIFYTHPLSVLWHIYDDDHVEGEKPSKLLTMRFEYLMKLNVVCAGTEGAHDCPLQLLTNLFPDDTGLDLPTQVAKLSAGLDFQYDCKRTSHPYKWVQHLAGLDFLAECPPAVLNGNSSAENTRGSTISNGLAAYRRQHRVQVVLEKLRRRRKDHLALKDQLDALTNLNLPAVHFTEVPWAFHHRKCYLLSWVEVVPSGLQKSNDGISALTPLSPAVDGITASPKSSLESAREDGELPSLGIGTGLTGKKYTDMANRKGFPVKEKRLKESPFSYDLSQNAFIASSKSRSTASEGCYNGDLVDENVLSGLAEDSTDDVSLNETSDSSVPLKVVSAWEDCGIRVFTGILKRDDGAGGKAVVLEAQVKISSEYPTRPPQFTLQLPSEGLVPTLPSAPTGVLDVVEAPRSSLASMHSFNELRAIEIEVNLRGLEALPQSCENEILAHQLSLLSTLFDTYVDHQLSRNCGKQFLLTSDTDNGHGFDSRLLRGRQRQMVLF